MARNYYQILRITKEATLDQIRKAYLKMVLKFHPDKNPNLNAERRFKKIQEAYDVLTERRDIYDKFAYDENEDDSDYIADEFYDADVPPEYGDTSYSYCFTDGNRYDPWETSKKENESKENFEKKNCFENGEKPKNFKQENAKEESGKDEGKSEKKEGSNEKSEQKHSRPENGNVKQDPPIEHDLFVSLEEIFLGCTKKMKITRLELNGNCSSKKSKILTVNVKPGWKAGTRITFAKEGDQFLHRIPADVVFIIREKSHPYFLRDGNDILYTYELTLKQALCGSSIEIPTLIKGTSINILLTDVTKPCAVRRIKEKGFPISRSQGERGDLVVTFKVLFPEKIPVEVQRFLEREL